MLLQASISLLLLMSLETSTGNQLFSSLQFTRDTLMGFSRGSERTVEILTPEKETKTLTFPRPTASKTKVKLTFHKRVEMKRLGIEMTRVHVPVASKDSRHAIRPHPGPKATSRPVTETVIRYQKKRKTYRPRTSPSNKFLEAINGIERAVANARASGVRYSEATLAKLKRILVTAIRSKSYKYAREVLGQIMYLLSTKTSPPGRRKRSSQNEGGEFLQGLRQQVGSSTFDSFMAVQGDVSLMFVIDDTGSMGNEIQATKNIAIDIINYPRQAPVEYILSPFNDPYPDESPVVFKDEIDAGEFVEAINDLTPHGGGDCPELAFTGMLEALYQEPQWGSPMYVFTDAGPKDASDEFIEEVKYLASAEEFGVTINFFTTGFCRSQGYSGGDPRNLHPAFKELAELTSGQAILLKDHWELETLDGLTGGVLEGTNVISMGSNMSGRKKRSVGVAADSRYNIPVDESIEKMLVTVSTTKLDTRGQGITLMDPDDIIITSGKLSLSQISVYQIDNPKKGAWTLVVSGGNGGHEFYVKSTSETNVDFEHYFIISLRGRRGVSTEVPISNPVIGKLNKMVLTVAGSEKIDTSSVRLELITTEGARISDVTLQRLNDVHFTASITPRSSQPFKLKIRGTTRGGNSFERISRQTIKPTTALLRGKYASNDYTLPLGAVTFVHFQLCNFGASEYFDVTVVKDKMGYVISPNVRPRRVMKGRCTTLSIRARATRSQDVKKTNTVFIIAKGRTSKFVVSQAVRLFVVPGAN